MSSEQFISSPSFDEVMKRKSSLCPTEKNSLVSKEQNHHFNIQQKYRGENRFSFFVLLLLLSTILSFFFLPSSSFSFSSLKNNNNNFGFSIISFVDAAVVGSGSNCA